MKRAATVLLAVFTAITFSCSSDDDDNNNNDDSYIAFKVNGIQKEFDTETLTSQSTLILGFEGSGSTYQAVSLWLPNNATVGTHTIVPNNGSQIDVYSAIYNETFDLQAEATTGTLVITSITENFITGTFSFTGTDSEGTTYNITEGEFKADNGSIPEE